MLCADSIFRRSGHLAFAFDSIAMAFLSELCSLWRYSMLYGVIPVISFLSRLGQGRTDPGPEEHCWGDTFTLMLPSWSAGLDVFLLSTGASLT